MNVIDTVARPSDDASRAEVETAIAEIARATSFYVLENAWVTGLRAAKASKLSGARDQVLIAAGRRLHTLGELPDDVARRCWLEQVAEGVRVYGDSELGSDFRAMIAAELREAFARIAGELSVLREALAAGETLDEFADRRLRLANRIRDVGRIAETLRGTDLLASCPADDCGLARALARAANPPIHLVPTVPGPLQVSREQLLEWATSADAAGQLPQLVRMLIAETEPSAEFIDMPSGSGVAVPGWDGVVKCGRGNRFVPAGLSVWELTAQQSGTATKTRRDYDKRAAEAPAAERADVTYVAVACAAWTKARAFEQEVDERGDFRYVRAINADGLADWLSCAPITTVWLREQTGLPSAGFGLLSGWWRKWLESTTVPLDAGIVLAGRDKAAQALRDRCRRDHGVLTIGGQAHRDEMLAFVAATLLGGGSSAPFGDVLFVDSHDAAQQLFAAERLESGPSAGVNQPTAAIVVPSRDFARQLPVGSRHLMVVPLPGSQQADIVLEPVDGEVVARQLEAAIAPPSDAHRLGGIARMSLMTLRRYFARQPELHAPSWSNDSPDAALRRCLLLGGWNDARQGDRQTVEQLVGCPYDEVTEALHQLDTGDAPILRTGDLWHAVSPGDSWALIRHHLTPADLSAYAAIAPDVLTASDPLREMTDDEAFRARIDGVETEYSPQIKRGVATTLALACSQASGLPSSAADATATAESVAWQVLRAANDDETPRTWSAIAEVLPLLAEAVPDAVLEALRSCVSCSHAFATAMFVGSGDDWLSSLPLSPHLDVLTALKILAWSPDHLLAAVELLARLAGIGTDDAHADRLAEGLASIMCPWMPHTSADLETRLRALRMLVRTHGGVAWRLMLTMLPNRHDSQIDGPHPHYRDWRRAQPGVSQREYRDTVEATAALLLDNVDADAERWVNLLSKLSDLPAAARADAEHALDQIAKSGPTERFKSALWPVLRELLADHRQFSDTWWALPEAELERLDRVLECLQPADPVAADGHLFSSDLLHIDGIAADDPDGLFAEALRTRQEDAVRSLLAAHGLDGVLRLAQAAAVPHWVGVALAAAGPTLDVDVLTSMHGAPAPIIGAGIGYFGTRFENLGWAGVNRLIADNQPSPQAAADLLRAVPASEQAWDGVDRFGPDVAAEYWARVTHGDLGRPDDLEQLLDLSRRLRTAERLDLVAHVLSTPSQSHRAESAYAEEAAAFLAQQIQHPDVGGVGTGIMQRRRLRGLFGVLDRHRDHLGAGRVALLEWQYYPLLGHEPGFSAPNLYREMANDPEFFAQLVEWAFKPASATLGGDFSADEQQQQLAVNAWQVLRTWPPGRFVPCLAGDTAADVGTKQTAAVADSADDEAAAAHDEAVDEASLNSWVKRARARLAETGRADIGDEQIGAALAATPADPNGDWPGAAMRDLLERLQSADIDSGISMTLYNRRGGTARGITEGGTQERELAEDYRARSRRFQAWPRTAAIFAGLARSYENEALIADREAETHRRGMRL
ncbi:MAG: hypothetical protein OXM54_00545 [Acidimicrobiaceae bacterium]|nr:hypothetical protein [Acidimicrobiaceae bacterium]